MIKSPGSKWLKRIAIITLITIHHLQTLGAQAAGLLIEKYSNEDHGGGSISNSILEDSTGSIFLANEAGLLKYDGEAWIQMPGTNRESLVSSATIDTKNRVWIIGIGTIGYYESDDHGRYNYNDLTASVRALPESSDLGTFWEIRHFQDCVFLITSNYVLKWRDEQWKAWEFRVKRRILPSWCDNELYIHARGNGLFRFSGDQFEFLVPDTPEISSGIIGIVDQTERGLLCATVSNGLFWLKDRKFIPIKSDIHKATITHASKLKNGDLAIGTAEQGLKILDQTGALINQVSINQKPIYKCLESSHGSIWVVGSGKVYAIKNRFIAITDENAQDILQIKNRIYYTNGRQLKTIHLQNRVTWQASEVIDEASSLWDIDHINEDIVYGTATSFRSIDRQGSKSETTSPRAITAIYPSKEFPDLIYTADVPQVSCWKKNDKQWEMINTLDNFNSGAASLIELSKSKLLISAAGGALYLANSPSEASGVGKWTTLYKLGSKHGLSDQFIWAHCLRVEDKVIVVSDKGLYCYDNETEKFHYDPALGDDLGTGAFGLESCPLGDDVGWALRLESQDSLGKQKNVVGRLILNDSGKFQWKPWNLPSLNQAGKVEALLHEVTDGKEILWVGGSKSLLRYELSALPEFEPIKTAITSIRERSGHETYFAGAGTARESYEWDYPQQSLRIEYAAPPSAIAVEGYQTRLLGFNDDWSEISPDTFSDFTNLHEGSYRFEVRAIDEFGRHGTIHSFRFLIDPPWYRTSYAYTAACLALAISIWSLVRLRSRHLIRRNEELENLINERTYKIECQKLELEQANRAKQNFLASMSHEIRNPLNGILGIARLMHQKEAQSGLKSEEVAHLYTSTNHLHQLLGQTLDYSSMESGKLRARSETFEACKLIDEVIEMHRSMADSKGLRLISNAPERPCYWKGDPVLLKQILINLISNAIKYTDSGSVVLKLSHEEAEDSVLATFEVTDTGQGIPEDKRSYIFEEFTRLTLPGESNIPGTGLGLAIASEMSKLIGGKLCLDPSYTAGARFRLEIELEINLHAQVTSKRQNYDPKMLSGQKALIADDLDFNRYINAETLKRLGATTDTAKNGSEALQKLSEQKFDIAILDVNMPGLTGMEVVQQYLQRCPDKPATLIALSAYNTPEMEASCLDAGFDYFLEKPLEPLKLIGIFGHHPRRKEDSTSNMMDYIANGDSTLLAELTANYMQSLNEGLRELQGARLDDNISLQRDLIHKLIGLTCIRKDDALTDTLRRLAGAIKQSAPEAEVEALIHQVIGQIQSLS